MLTKVNVSRSGNPESYILFDNGLLIQGDDSFVATGSLPFVELEPSDTLFNRLVMVNTKVRELLSLKPDQITKL